MKGVSLIELLAAVFLVSAAMSMMSLFLPRASKAVFSGHYAATAKSLAAGKIQELKQNPYALVPVTPPGTPLNTNCDCNVVPAASLPLDTTLNGTGTLNENGITFKRQLCVNLVTVPAWNSNCPNATGTTDFGTKNIRVRVTWLPPGAAPNDDPQSFEMESVVSR